MCMYILSEYCRKCVTIWFDELQLVETIVAANVCSTIGKIFVVLRVLTIDITIDAIVVVYYCTIRLYYNYPIEFTWSNKIVYRLLADNIAEYKDFWHDRIGLPIFMSICVPQMVDFICVWMGNMQILFIRYRRWYIFICSSNNEYTSHTWTKVLNYCYFVVVGISSFYQSAQHPNW